MKRTILALLGTVTGLVMLLSFKSHPVSLAATPGAGVSTTAPQTSGDSGGTSAATPTTAPSSSSANGSGSSTSSTSSGTKTVTGDAVDTRFGPVQVQITVTSGKVTSVQAVEYPQENPRDQQINSYAIPALNQEATSAGSASIDTISGATYTSDGYIQSLQSALDKAGL